MSALNSAASYSARAAIGLGLLYGSYVTFEYGLEKTEDLASKDSTTEMLETMMTCVQFNEQPEREITINCDLQRGGVGLAPPLAALMMSAAGTSVLYSVTRDLRETKSPSEQ